MYLSLRDRHLGQRLRQLSSRYNNRYGSDASEALLRTLFRHLADDNEDYLRLFFPTRTTFPENQQWRLSEAQGAVDGAEYSPSARGRRCGHIFKNGEATYSCRTCTTDDTCVLCTRCFEASDHEGHQVYVSISSGSSGCCDCEDPEAWIKPVKCSLHTPLPNESASKDTGKGRAPTLPPELQESIRATISRALDFLCDILSCCPEKMTPPTSEASIRQDEEKSRLMEKLYGGVEQREKEFALILWNDEKHSVDEVAEMVARACRRPRRSFGLAKALEVDDIGRSVLYYSTNLEELLGQARILAHINVTVTIRSSRDTFREEMCGTIIQWLSDIAGCSVGSDSNILMDVICEEMLKPWRIGSEAFNLSIAKNGIIDHQRTDYEPEDRLRLMRDRFLGGRRATTLAQVQGLRMVNIAGEATLVRDPTGNADVDEDENMLERNQGDDNRVDDEDGMDLDELLVGQDDEEIIEIDTTTDDIYGMEDIGIRGPVPSMSLQHDHNSDGSDVEMPVMDSERDTNKLFTGIPLTPNQSITNNKKAPTHWTKRRNMLLTEEGRASLLAHEDLSRRIRIDHLIMYDLRLWKRFRTNLKHLYISTVVTIPGFKRILSLRFAALYTHLAQLYLVADREPDHSIINLSLQMLTTPSITAEVVRRGNFLTRLLAILYTFLTKMQVGNPEDVDATAMMAFEAGVMTNRRIYHFFSDMKYLLDVPYVMDQIRTEQEYLLQFLDFAKLYQGICPNIRAVGEHIEYESDSWITASFIVRDVTRMSRQFCDSFTWTRSQDPASICRAIRQTAKVTMLNSLGAECARFTQSELKQETRFKAISFNSEQSSKLGNYDVFNVVEFEVEKGSLSFHHALHYTLSWLIDCGKSMSRDQLHNLLTFTPQQLQSPELRYSKESPIPKLSPQEYLLALFDIPLRVCAWLAQMKAGMWVRNGITLRHQMSTYRGVGQRDVSHQRDLFLLQVAFAVCNPASFLAAVIDRFGMSEWIRGDFTVKDGFEDHQLVDMAEELVHLLIVLLSERTLLLPNEEDANPAVSSARRDIIHVLCFKPLTYSELTVRLSDKVQELDTFNEILKDVATYRAPEGLSDSGLLQLKTHCYKGIDPYHVYYSKSQREEAESIYRKHVSEQTGKLMEDVFFVPELRPVRSGIFTAYGDFSQMPLFVQIIHRCLAYVLAAEIYTPQIPSGRPEALLQTVLHLALIAVLEERAETTPMRTSAYSFTELTLHGIPGISGGSTDTVLQQLFMLVKNDRYRGSKYRVRFLLKHIRDNRPAAFELALSPRNLSNEWAALMGTFQSSTAGDLALKKKQAMERQVKVMADFAAQQKNFLQNQPIDWGADDVDNSDEEMEETMQTETWVFPSGTCIFCQEETKDQQLYGTLGYLANSKIFRQTDLKDAQYIAEICSIPRDLDQSFDNIRPFGVAGQNVQHIHKATASGQVVTTERKGLGKGFPVSQHQQGPVVTGCGHLMHYSCFQTYDDATIRRHQFQVARMHPEDIHLKEFVCPLCKALGNVFLPVVWKAKPIIDMPISDTDSFIEWVNMNIKNGDVKGSPLEASASMFGESLSRSSEAFLQQYAISAFNTHLATALSTEFRVSSHTSPVTSAATGPRFRIPSFLRFDPRGSPTRERPAHDSASRSLLVAELEKAYQRIGDTMRQNGMSSNTPNNVFSGELSHADVLAKALGYTVSAVELGQRGIGSSTGLFLDSIPEQTTTHLKVLSETISSYIALDGLRPWSRNSPKLLEISRLQSQQLFGCDEPLNNGSLASTKPLLTEDLFAFLAECTAFMIPTFGLEAHQVLRLCYIAEIVKVVTTFLYEPDAAWHCAQLENPNELEQSSSRQSQQFSAFVEDILIQCRQAARHGGIDLPQVWINVNPNTRYRFDELLRQLVSKYALTFLRKATLLFHVRYGVKLGRTSSDLELHDSEFALLPEIVRISRVLGLPGIEELVGSFVTTHSHSAILHHLSSTWIRQWSMTSRHQMSSSATKTPPAVRSSLQLSHPSVYELVALPYTHDILNVEALSRRCSSTGGELTDPSICLLCGTFVCSQSRCCTVEDPATQREEGGCCQHRKKCGGPVGIFLNIRKCAVLCLYEDRGSFFTAPYLDKHGEVDVGLRRKNQLFLNQRRYDKLYREMWLNHQIPSAVARKLEAEINTGGWSTI